MTYYKRPAPGQATMANSEPVVIASDQSTVPVSLASVPSHAVTNAGTFAVQNTAATPAGTNNIGDVDVLTVNGVAPAFGSGVRGATVQRVTIATDDSVPVTLAANQSVNVAQVGGVATTTGNGVSGTGVQRVSIASDSTGNIATIGTSVTPGTAATNLGKARDSAIGATDTGVAILGVRRDTPTAETPVAGDYVVPQISANGETWVGMAASATNSPAKARDAVAGASDTGIPAQFVRRDAPTAVTPVAGDYEFAQISNLGAQYVHPVAHTAGGATPYRLVSAASTNATNVKASAGQVYMITASNVNAAVRYLKFYNKASAPTVGTDTPVHTFAIPGNTAGAGTNIPVPACGIAFSTGIAFALTTEATDAGTTAVAASEIVVNLAYL